MGLFSDVSEEVRAAQASEVLARAGVARLGTDDRYWRQFSFAFHLHTGEGAPLVFPLVLNPTSIRTRHPFAAELQPVQEGGVSAEENGILISDLVLTGHTGLAPRLNPGGPAIPLSGQAHFLHLRDACFFRYSDLKKDPKRAGDVYMTFHNFKDSDHWIVVPRELSLERGTDKNMLYRYTITAAIVGPVENPPPFVSEDGPVLRSIKDAAAQIAKAEALARSRIADLVGPGYLDDAIIDPALGVLPEVIDVIGKSIAGALEDTTQILGATSEFLSGVEATIRLPVRFINDVVDRLELAVFALDRAGMLPIDISETHLQIVDGLLRLAMYPEKFKESFTDGAARFLALTQGPANGLQEAIDAAAASTITQASDFENSGLLPGDATRIKQGLFDLTTSIPRYRGFREVDVLFGDSLAVIAARELGDARRWLDIAIANDLRAPYISDEGLPNTLRPGQPILIPTTEEPKAVDQVRSSGNPVLGESQLDALFGTDLKATYDEDEGAYDFVVSPESLTDFQIVSGEDNLGQAVTAILSTEKGANVMYQQVGYDRIVGKKGTVERFIEARSRVVAAVQRDPRVSRVQNASFTLDGDSLVVELDVVATNATPLRVLGRVLP